MAKTQLEINAAAANLAKSGLDELALQGTRGSTTRRSATRSRGSSRLEPKSSARRKASSARPSSRNRRRSSPRTRPKNSQKLEAKAEQQRAIDEVARAVKAKGSPDHGPVVPRSRGGAGAPVTGAAGSFTAIARTRAGLVRTAPPIVELGVGLYEISRPRPTRRRCDRARRRRSRPTRSPLLFSRSTVPTR